MKVNMGDLYTRHADGKIYRVKRIDNKMIVLELVELQDGPRLRLTDIFALEKAYSKRESEPTSS